MQWERKYFPQLDTWYEEENYEAIQNFFNETDEAADGIQYNTPTGNTGDLWPFTIHGESAWTCGTG